jgi:putative Mn2+ efflux pump MntP
MGFFEIFLIAVGLAMDAFAVALAAGTSGHGQQARPAVRLAFHLGLFQFLMPVIGWFLGVRLARLIQDYDHSVAFALLAAVGGHMIWESFQREEHELPADPTRGWRMVTLSVATSLDALAVGLSLAMLQVTIWFPSIVIGVVTATLSLVGIYLGNRLRGALGKQMEFVGGLVLIGIGIRILWMHCQK